MGVRDDRPVAEDLSERDLQVLEAIIDDYIETAEPVGSRTLARGHGLEVSPATIRNVMSDLEAMGLLEKPHTSAGRVPTPKAFRLYVESIMKVRPLPSRARARIERGYEPAPDDVNALVQRTGQVLSRLTHHAAVVATPRFSQTTYRQIRFVRLRENRVLAILVTEAGLVQNRVLLVEEDVSQAELDRMGRYLDELLGERTVAEVREAIAEELAEERAAYDRLLRQALELGSRAVADVDAGDVVVEGQSALLDQPEFADPERLRELLSALEEKQSLLKILEQAERGSGIQIYIGAESDLAGTDDVAMVLANYKRGEQVLGALGVIGPTRMDYARLVPLVEYTATLVGRLLAGSDGEG
ncbi:MAG: heat-inducible transcription repressor HrcA [Deltaproteobacteria bacterium]|nr:MAG: heat-inducible transcription repressor HrcA [Deltaproteobacteria bacterium]